MNVYDAGTNGEDYDADIWASVTNTHNRTHMVKVIFEPVLESGARLDEKKDTEPGVNPGETVQLQDSWNSRTNIENNIVSVQVTVKMCDSAMFETNCEVIEVVKSDR